MESRIKIIIIIINRYKNIAQLINFKNVDLLT